MPILSIQEIPDRTTVDPFRHPQRTAQFVNLFPRYDPLRPPYTPTPSILGIPARTTLGHFRHLERTWPNLSIYVSAVACLDPVRRPCLRFMGSLLDLG